MKKGFLYLIQSGKDQSLYIGSTGNFENRLAEHNRGKSSSTHAKTPWQALKVIECESLLQARKLERLLKTYKRKMTQQLFFEFVKKHLG